MTPRSLRAEGIGATTPAGRLQLHVLGAIEEFESITRLRERVMAGLTWGCAQGVKLGRPRRDIAPNDWRQSLECPREAARRLGVRVRRCSGS